MSKDNTHKRRRVLGRPKDLLKRQAIIAAARSLFFSRGVDDVGMEQIAAKAEVSKMTVYAHFGDKASILDAVVGEEARRMAETLTQAPGDGRDVVRRLTDFGVALLTFVTSSEILAFDRLVAAQATRNPDIPLAMVKAGPRFACRKIAEQLNFAVQSGQLVIANADKAAEQLIGLWLGMPYLECRMGTRPPLGRAAILRLVEDGIELVMRAYSPTKF